MMPLSVSCVRALTACLVATTALTPFHSARADIIDGRYGVNQVFDALRSPAYPTGGSPYNLNSFKAPYKDNDDQYDIGTGYISFFYTGDANNLVGIKLYTSDGTFVETISEKGDIYALGNEGFLYESDNEVGLFNYGTFISNSEGFSYGDEVTYTPESGEKATMSELQNYVATADPLGDGETTSTPPSTPVTSEKKFTPVSTPGLSGDMAGVMDDLKNNGGASSGLNTALDHMAGLSDQSRSQGLKKVAPNAGAVFNQVSSKTLVRNNARIGGRLNEVRNSNNGGIRISSGNPSAQLGYAEEDLTPKSSDAFDQLLAKDEFVTTSTNGGDADNKDALGLNSLWGQVYGHKTFQGADDGYAGYQSFGHNYLVGLDVSLFDTTIIGIAGGYDKTYVEMSDYRSGDTSNIDSYQVSLYGSHEFAQGWITEAILSYVRHEFYNKRNTSLDTALADFGANRYGARVDVSRLFEMQGGFTLLPKVGVAWSSVHQEGYSETASLLAQSVSRLSSQTFETDVSLEIGRQFIVSEALSITPNASIGWRHNFLSDGTDVTARFIGGGSSFTTTGQALAADTFSIKTGLEVLQNNSLEVNLGLEGDFAENYQNYGADLRVTWNF